MCKWVFKTLPWIFLDETLFQNVVHVNNFPLLGDVAHVALGILSSCVVCQPFYLTYFFLISFGGFPHESYVGMWGHYGSRIEGVFSGPFSKVLGFTTDILWWYRPCFYGRLCLICFSSELGFGGFVFVL